MLEAITIAAIIIGPIVAVLITRWLDDRRERSKRRMDIFRTLMRTRRATMSADHVGALNLVEIEFNNEKLIIKAWTDLFVHLGSNHSRHFSESIENSMKDDEKRRREVMFDERIFKERQSFLAKLLHAMARKLNFRIEQLEIFEGGYIPQGWVDADLELRVARKFVVDLYFGNRILPVGVVNYSDARSGASDSSSSVSPPAEPRT